MTKSTPHDSWHKWHLILVAVVILAPVGLFIALELSDVRIGESRDSLGGYIRDLDAGNERRRCLAAEGLVALGSHAKPAIPKLRSIIDDPSPKVRIRAAVALWQTGNEPEPLLRELSVSLGEFLAPCASALEVFRGDYQTEGLRAFALSLTPISIDWRGLPTKSGTTAKAMRERRWTGLANSLLVNDTRVRRMAAFVILVYLQADDVEMALGQMLQALRGDDDEVVCLFLAGAVAKIGPQAKAAAPALRELLRKCGHIDLGMVAPMSFIFGDSVLLLAPVLQQMSARQALYLSIVGALHEIDGNRDEKNEKDGAKKRLFRF
jgi:HEAT repeat protein